MQTRITGGNTSGCLGVRLLSFISTKRVIGGRGRMSNSDSQLCVKRAAKVIEYHMKELVRVSVTRSTEESQAKEWQRGIARNARSKDNSPI
jgi:hypothetical protein